MNIYDDQTDLVIASWQAARRRERIAHWAIIGLFAGLGGVAIAWWLAR